MNGRIFTRMTPPPGSPVNDFEDTHVMETRHPLTIPAAIVLGTATFNCIFVEVLATPLKKVLKR